MLGARLFGAIFASLIISQGCAAAPVTQLHLISIDRGPTAVSVTKNRATVVVFVALDCPMSMDYGRRLGELEKHYAGKGVQLIFVDSNRNETNADIVKARKSLNIGGQIFRDPTTAVADLLTAIVTPTAVVLDSSGAIRYKGAIDDSRDPSRIKVHFVEDAVESILGGREVAVPHTRVLGCTIKR